jgi:hypothetical protein
MSAAEHAYRLWVAELSDQAGPRLLPDRPNLHVGVTISDPESRFEWLKRGMRPEHPVAQFGVRLRADLYECLPAYSDQAGANSARKELVHRLRREAFVVNGVRHRYRVYVIELSDEVGPRKVPDKPWVYVGQTLKDVEDRWKEHKSGARNGKGPLYSRVVKRYGIGLRSDLYESLDCVYTLESARQLERKVAAELSRRGFSVKGGH